MTRPRGFYDQVLTEGLDHALSQLAPDIAHVEPLQGESVAPRIVDAVREQLERVLASIAGEQTDRALAQLELVNGILRGLRARSALARDQLDPLAAPPRVLHAISGPSEEPSALPETGLVMPWLFTAGPGTPALLAELRREAASCDHLDILVSFITKSGVRKLLDVFREITAADASGSGHTRIRVLTTTYLGATEIDALDDLARLNGTEVRVSLDGRRSRLHAKAWIFRRRTGFGSAYVGSANFSHVALAAGLEWTVKFTQRGQQALFSRAEAHFDSLWEDREFERYDPEDQAMRHAVRVALGLERRNPEEIPTGYFEIHPKHYQLEMLADLARERAQGRTRSLVVSATGTGKTVLAALDYRNTCQQLGHRPRLLYVAHRAQILRQALRTYREVLRDHSFGGLLTGSEGSGQFTHVFATIDTLASRDLVRTLGPEYWHTVVIDECHRLAGPRFDALASTITPQLLLGLTATPERTDGRPIEIYFTPRPDRSPAIELRLWDALDMQLLAPFEYYACDDDTDFSEVQWDRPGELTALDGLVTGNMVRARMIVNEWRRLATNPRKSRALVFCVSVAHAHFMTEQLKAAGLPAACVTGETPKADQVRAVKHLERNDVCALITVDLFNEGVDVPSVDTLLLLRPTQSPVLFQQQIGRGLRLAPGKDGCLILDFVGQHRADFRFDRLLTSITGLTRAQLIDAVESGFSTLPAGCHIHLHRRASEQVLRNLRTLTQQSWRRLTSELRSYAELRRPVTLPDFLYHQRLALEEVYRTTRPSGWTTLRRSAGLLSGEEPSGESQLSSRFGDLQHVDDPDQISTMRSLAADPGRFARGEAVDPLRAQMLAYQVDSGREALPYSAFARRVAESPSCAAELGELADVLAACSRIDAGPVPGLEDLPFHLHAAYRIREILTAVGFLTESRRTPFQAGVLALPLRKTELLFVTLDKSQGFHERIAYHDYAVSPARFHWQTQNAAGPDTRAGRRYIESPLNGWTFQLFIRVTKDDPYRACGPVRLVDPQDVVGDRPMSITWTLEVPLPPHLFREFSVLRGQS